MTTDTEKVHRSENVRVRIEPQEKDLVRRMMREDLIVSESTFIRRLIAAEARRRGLLNGDARKSDR